MRTETHPLADELRYLRLSKAEKTLMRRAAFLLFQLREKLEAEDMGDEEFATDVALAAYTCADLSTLTTIDLPVKP